MRKVALSLAMSLDGYIADTDGGFDWIVGHGDHTLDTQDSEVEFEQFLQGTDLVVMGSKSYEDCVLTGLNTFDDKEILVATRRALESRDNVRFIDGDICKIVLDLKSQKGKDIFLFGGAFLADQFIKENAIDKYMIGIIPTILGAGRRLFSEGSPKIDLILEKVSISDGISIHTFSKR